MLTNPSHDSVQQPFTLLDEDVCMVGRAYLASETSFWVGLFKLVLARQKSSRLKEINHFSGRPISVFYPL